MKPSITPRPFSQNAGSPASRPKGASNSLCRLAAAGARACRDILPAKPRSPLLIDRVERVHQAIAERIGIDIERRMDEMRDVGPERPVVGVEIAAPARGSRAAPPSKFRRCCSAVSSPSRRSIMQAALEFVEGDLPHDRVQHVLDLAGEQMRLRLASVSGFEQAWKVSISPNTDAVSARVSGVSDIRAALSAPPAPGARHGRVHGPSVITSRVRPW